VEIFSGRIVADRCDCLQAEKPRSLNHDPRPEFCNNQFSKSDFQIWLNFFFVPIGLASSYSPEKLEHNKMGVMYVVQSPVL
jgi:hypothetical protein